MQETLPRTDVRRAVAADDHDDQKCLFRWPLIGALSIKSHQPSSMTTVTDLFSLTTCIIITDTWSIDGKE
jgi:hypothetical protein